MSDPQSKGILTGLRVLDLSRMLSGPYCTMMLADHGAEVIKVESAGGDTSRKNGPFRDDDPDHEWAGYFVSLNRNKKSVQLDLKTDEGRIAFRRLADTADVLVENFRPGVMERLGLSYESLAETNPRLVYAAIRGFGDPRTGESPYGNWPSYDVVAQAMGGIMSLTGPAPDSPTKVGPGIGDVFAGMMMAFGVMAALRQAGSTGKGQFVDVAMYDAMISLCERAIYLHDFEGSLPGPEGNDHPFLAPFGLFPASDGSVALGIVDDAFWAKLCAAMDLPDLAQEPKFATRAARAQNRDTVNAIVSEWTIAHSKLELSGLLGGLVPFGPLQDIADIMADPHVAARKMLAQVPHPDQGAKPWTVAANPLRFENAPLPAVQTPPRLGADNDTYLHAPAVPEMTDNDKRALRNAFGSFATGVTVVTTRQPDGTPRGFTANSFSSVSLDPPLLLICIAKTAQSLDTFTSAPHFSINVLNEEQKAISGLFASQSAEKFDIADWHSGAADMPLLDDTLAGFVCSREQMVDAGDHIVLIGRVISYETRDGPPLGYFKGNYFTLGLERPLVSAASQHDDVSIGALAARDQELLFTVTPDGSIAVPRAPAQNKSRAGLTAALKADGLSAHLDFLYAVYQDSESGGHGIYYHGSASGEAPQGYRYFALDDVPLECISNTAERSMVARYIEEFRHGSFGIYQGDETQGRVHRILAVDPSTH